MTNEKTFTRKTVNRLRKAQDEIQDLAEHTRSQAAKWLKADDARIHVPVPLVFDGEGQATTILVRLSLGGDQFGEDFTDHRMPVNYLFAADEELDADYQKFQELRARFEA